MAFAPSFVLRLPPSSTPLATHASGCAIQAARGRRQPCVPLPQGAPPPPLPPSRIHAPPPHLRVAQLVPRVRKLPQVQAQLPLQALSIL